MDTHNAYSHQASLVILGQFFQRLELWTPVEQHVKIKQKVRQHTPTEKLLDALITILAGGRGIVESQTRVRPDRAVQMAFGRRQCAEQSTISNTLNACRPENVVQMRTALQMILRQHSQCYRHDYAQAWQVLDVDLTGLVAGRQAEGATKGYFAHQRSKRGRQLGRVLATAYGELVVERLYAGKRQLEQSFQELILATEEVLELVENKRSRTIIRADGGAGTDSNIEWALPRNYHLLTKMHNWRRAARLAATVTEWYCDDKVADRELGWVTQPIGYSRATRQVVLRAPKQNAKGQPAWHYQVLVTTLTDDMLFSLLHQTPPATSDPTTSLRAIAHAYDQRDGALETENRNDKQGLGIGHRNKRSAAAQEMLVLLAELAHNLMIWARHRLSQNNPRFQKFGMLRLVRDVFQIDGQAVLSADAQVLQVALNPRHPYTSDVERAFHQ